MRRFTGASQLSQINDLRKAILDATMLVVPEAALSYGFTNGPGGTHTSRTMMLQEISLLFGACPPNSNYETYERAVVDENVLLRQTASTRLRTLRGLRELYSLDVNSFLFRALRDLWFGDSEAQPLLALLCASARDPLLRASSTVILDARVGDNVTPSDLAGSVNDAFPGRYNPNTLAKIGRNTASSWQQSGHLQGRAIKTRVRAQPTPASTAYALLLGHLCGARGDGLFETLWARLLDVPTHTIRELTTQASRQGWLEYRHTGAVTDVSFNHLLRPIPSAS